LRDYSGGFEIAVFPETFEKFKKLIVKDKILIVKGKVASRNGDKTLVTDEIRELV
jgi:DNA polymerase III alpha subunit